MTRARHLALPPLTVAMLLLAAAPAHADVRFFDPLTVPVEGSLITNEYAYWNPGAGVTSPHWEMDSGSVFAGGWTGVPDDCAPDRLSQTCTNSAAFRLTTRARDFGAVRVDAGLRANAWASTPSTPPAAWDGVHLWLRYQGEASLYYASVARRDGAIVVKKKCPGGPSNGGSYHTLGSRSGLPAALGAWRSVGATIDTAADGSVVIEAFRDGARVLSAVDSGVGCAAITAPGAVGVRGDNLDFNVRDFTVSDLHPVVTAAVPGPAAAPAPLPSAQATPLAAVPAPAARAGSRRPAITLRPGSRRFRRTLRLRVRTGTGVRRVTLHRGRRLLASARRAPFSLRARMPRGTPRGVHRLRVTAYDGRGGRLGSRTIRVRYLGR